MPVGIPSLLFVCLCVLHFSAKMKSSILFHGGTKQLININECRHTMIDRIVKTIGDYRILF